MKDEIIVSANTLSTLISQVFTLSKGSKVVSGMMRLMRLLVSVGTAMMEKTSFLMILKHHHGSAINLRLLSLHVSGTKNQAGGSTNKNFTVAPKG